MNKLHSVDDHMVDERRKTFVAREDLLRALAEIAKENGKSLYETVNEIFESAILFNKADVKMDAILEDYEKIKSAKEAGYILCLENLWSEINEIAYRASPAETIASWRNAGIWLAKRHVSGHPVGYLDSIKDELACSLWNASELSMKWDAQGGEVEINVLAPRFSRSQSELLASFLEGMLSALGLSLNGKEFGSGFVRVLGARQKAQIEGESLEKS